MPIQTLKNRVLAAVREAGLPEPEHEVQFHPKRKWRFDLAYPALKLAIEIDGTGRHNTVAGMANDDEKLNEAIIMGWVVLRFNAKLIAATGKPGKGVRKLPYEPISSVLARAWQSRNR
jgi:very-short-patch-repair endonuclease